MKKEVVAAVLNASLQMQVSLTNGGKDWDKITAPLYKAMSDDIKKQKKRLGGDFAIAHAVNTRVGRDLIRMEMGEDVVFIVLNLTPACQEARIKVRHGDTVEGGMAEMFKEMMKLYDAAGEDEPQAHNLYIEEEDNPNMVLDKVLALIGHNKT